MSIGFRTWITCLVLMMLCGACPLEAEIPESLFGGGGSSLAFHLADAAVRRLEKATPEEAGVVLVLLQLMADTRGDAGERILIGLEDSYALLTIQKLLTRLEDSAATAPTEAERSSSHRSLTIARSVYSDIARRIGWDRRPQARFISASPAESDLNWINTAEPQDSQNDFQWFTIGDDANNAANFYELRAKGPTIWQVLITSQNGKILDRGKLASGQPFALSKFEPNAQVRLRAMTPEAAVESDLSLASFLAALESDSSTLEESSALEEPGNAIAVLRVQGLMSAKEKEDAPAAQAGERYRVRVEPDSQQWVRLKTEPEKLYTAETSDLALGCDTLIELYKAQDEAPEALLRTDDDSGDDLFASRLSWYSAERTTHLLRLSEVEKAGCLFSLSIREDKIQGIPVEGGSEPEAAESIGVGPSSWTVVNASSDTPVYLSFFVQAGKIYGVHSTSPVSVFIDGNTPAYRAWWKEGQESGDGSQTESESNKSYWASYGNGKFLIQAFQGADVSLPVISVTEEEPMKLPAEGKLGVRENGRSVPKLADGFSSIITIPPGKSLYSQIDVRKDDFVVIEHYPITPGLLVASSNGVQVSEKNEIFWTAESDSIAEVEFRNLGDVEGKFLLNVAVERPYSELAVGDEVVLQHHRSVGGDDNWADEMSAFVGKRAKIIELVDSREMIHEELGPYLVRVDADEGTFYWRARDLKRVQPEAAQAK